MPRKLGRTSKERNALLRGLASQLLWYGKIDIASHTTAFWVAVICYLFELKRMSFISERTSFDLVKKFYKICSCLHLLGK